MANTIPCPNPVCTHEFALAQLQAAAQLSCPKCGFKMQGKGTAKPTPPAPAKSAPPPAKPIVAKAKAAPAAQPRIAPASAVVTAQPVAATSLPPLAAPIAAQPMPPLATPILASPVAAAVVEPPKPAATNEESVAEGMFFNPDLTVNAGPLVRRSSGAKHKFSWLRLLLILFAIGFAVCVVVGVVGATVWLLLGKDGGSGLSEKERVPGTIYYGQIRSKEGNEKVYKLALVKEQWEVDQDMKSRFEAHAAWKHRDYDFFFAVVVKDYGMQKPRDAEMLRIGIDKLENVFGDALEIGKKAEPAKIGERASQKIEFKGQIKASNWRGECYMFFQNGIAYWLFIASPDKETIDYFAEKLPESNFFVESERRAWREQQPPSKTFASTDARLTISGLESVWEKVSDSKADDANGVLYLSGKYQSEKNNRKNATLLVFTFENKGDLKEAMATGRAYLDSKYKNENENYKVALATEVIPGQTDAGAAEEIGNRRGRIVDLKRTFNDEIQRYFLFGVVTQGDLGYGILCECSWDSRQIWRQDFLDVIRTIHFDKSE
jgi:hypothetical protein